MNDEFYIGWEDRAPSAHAKHVRRVALFLLCFAALVALALAGGQQLIGSSVFEWGNVKEFTGIYEAKPTPHLLVPRPGTTMLDEAYSVFHLVAPYKWGVPVTVSDKFDGKRVKLKGTLIYRGNQTMVEAQPESIQEVSSGSQFPGATLPLPISLGQQQLVGEIVDSKCFLGVMNPGQLTPHRACAIRCLSGGIPPVLLVRQTDGMARYYLLVSDTGEPVNKDILELVAEPVVVIGEVVQQGDLLILKANPKAIKRHGS